MVAGMSLRRAESYAAMRKTTCRVYAAIFACILAAMGICHAASVSLPPVFDSDDLLQSCVDGAESSKAVQLTAKAIGIATNNVGNIWTIDDEHQSPHVFDGKSGYALLQSSMWAEMRYSGWWVSYGKGQRDAYSGNADAARLWIDLHSGVPTQDSYEPTAQRARIMTSWYGLGRDIPFHAGEASGTACLQLRALTGCDYLSMAVTGNVESDGAFTGMMRSVGSGAGSDALPGDGWSLDGRLRLRFRDEWIGQLGIEGLLGRVSWRDLRVTDSRIVSPRTFTDPDGFLHDIGGVSGATWNEDRTLQINPYYRFDAVWTKQPYVLFGIGLQSGWRATPSLGFAWPQKQRKWLPFIRFYPAQQRFEIGAVGSRWQVRISGDDWILSSPKHAEVAASLQALRF